MPMNSAPPLLVEDRPEFERVLDEALRTARETHPPAAGPARLTAPQLRAMALSAAVPIAACATAEYAEFVRLRTELRHPAHAPILTGARAAHGAGLGAVLCVLAPLLAGAAAVIFLLLGYGMRLARPEPELAAPLRSVGWTFVLLAAVGALLGMAGMLWTALRNGTAARGDGGQDGSTGLAADVERARQAWRTALLERGVLPFLAEATAPRETERPDALS
jgi:hypothetical protein